MNRIKTHDGDTLLFRDWYNFGKIENDSSRTVMGILDLLGNVGGVQQVLLAILNFMI